MRLAPLMPLQRTSIAYRLAYLGDLIFPPVDLVSRPKVISRWTLIKRIIANLLWTTALIAFAVLGVALFLALVYEMPEVRISLAVIMGSVVMFTLWSGLRVRKRLHVLRRRICPPYIIE